MDGFVDASEMLKGGVYLLLHRGEIVYVGQAKRFLNRLSAHLTTWASERKKKQPWIIVPGIYFDQVLIKPEHPDRIDALERELIALYKPKHNTQHVRRASPEFSIKINNAVIAFNQTRPTLPLIERRP